jgi:hypothetical protein
MTVEIHLLGSPRIVRDGVQTRAPRGNKGVGAARLPAAVRGPAEPVAGGRAAVPGADDPLAALRWNLSVLRGVLGEPEAFCGNPLSAAWTEPPAVDVLAVRSVGWADIDAIYRLGPDTLVGPAGVDGVPGLPLLRDPAGGAAPQGPGCRDGPAARGRARPTGPRCR